MLIHGNQVSTWCILLILSCLCLVTSGEDDFLTSKDDDKDPLVATETKDDKTIIKQISKLNEDGTYTFGYEADDGTFKYESRDVLGNIKGTVGFVDHNGVIKRISYIANDNNTTSDSSTSVEVLDEAAPLKTNKTQTTRRPSSSLIYPQISTTRSNVIQSIPRKKPTSTTSPSVDTSNKTSSTLPPKLVFATSIPSTTPKIIMPSSPHTRPVLQNGMFIRSTIPPQNHGKIEGQLIRPAQVTDSTTVKPVTEANQIRRFITARQLPSDTSKSSTESQITSSTSRPILESHQYSDRDNQETAKSHRSNTFRRQLTQEKETNFDPHQHVLNYQQSNGGGDVTDIYGSSVTTGTQRPLFTTTQSTRSVSAQIPRQANLRNNHFLPNGYQRHLIRNRQDPLVEAPSTQPPTTEEPYQTQETVPVIPVPEYSESPIHHRPVTFARIRASPSNILRNREYLREVGPQMEIAVPENTYSSPQDNDQYLRESPSQNGPLQFPPTPSPTTNRIRKVHPLPQQIAYSSPDYNDQNYQNPIPVPVPVPIPVPPQNYRNYPTNDISNIISEDIQPPVTNRDFQRLLNQLIYVQSKLQQLAQLAYQQNPNLEIFNPRYQQAQYYPTPIPVSVTRAPYGPVYFEPQNTQPLVRNREYLPGYQSGYEGSRYDPRYSASNIRRRYQYQPAPAYENQQTEYLPPEIREMLLLRMLQLAIHSELAATNQMEAIASAPTKAITRKEQHTPVRNVKIIGEEKERIQKTTSRNKRYQDPNEDMEYYE